MKKYLILLVALLISVPLGIWWFSPANVLERRAKHLMEVLSISEGSALPLRQGKVFSMNKLLDREVKISASEIDDANGTFDKQEIESGFSWICRNAKGSDFRITEYRKVELNGDEGKTVIVVEGYMEFPSQRVADGYSKVTINWRKSDDGWRFYKVVWEIL